MIWLIAIWKMLLTLSRSFKALCEVRRRKAMDCKFILCKIYSTCSSSALLQNVQYVLKMHCILSRHAVIMFRKCFVLKNNIGKKNSTLKSMLHIFQCLALKGLIPEEMHCSTRNYWLTNYYSFKCVFPLSVCTGFLHRLLEKCNISLKDPECISFKHFTECTHWKMSHTFNLKEAKPSEKKSFRMKSKV